MPHPGAPGPAPGVVKIRLSGGPGDVEAIAALLNTAAAPVALVDRSAPYPNRHDLGVRVYLTVRLITPKEAPT